MKSGTNHDTASSQPALENHVRSFGDQSTKTHPLQVLTIHTSCKQNKFGRLNRFTLITGGDNAAFSDGYSIPIRLSLRSTSLFHVLSATNFSDETYSKCA